MARSTSFMGAVPGYADCRHHVDMGETATHLEPFTTAKFLNYQGFFWLPPRDSNPDMLIQSHLDQLP